MWRRKSLKNKIFRVPSKFELGPDGKIGSRTFGTAADSLGMVYR